MSRRGTLKATTRVAVKSVPAPGLNPLSYINLRPTGLLSRAAARAGF